ncbi:cap methyltransferase 2 isoform X2 [Rhynchophorus ferrugineus]|uniref:cap methyltransferase 2 isoform X2 n=1 Tax=Rhynchophorus ferrugineus TaxID=354439 RepID=UPI003FCC2B81
MTHAQKEIRSIYFERIFHFEKDSWNLPVKVFNTDKFTVDELQDMKQSLNAAKSELNHFDLLEWSHYTKQRDVAGYVMPLLRKTVHPELLTQAWCKFYEIISTFPVFSHSASDHLRSLHLCEAPGAFVCALNHYIVLHYPHKKWYWLASTLNPHFEGNSLSQMIPDDRLINHTSGHWLFGLDQTGNIQKYYNHCNIVEKATSEYMVDLVTADGSIDCIEDPGEQERLVEFLQYCETFTALKCLKKEMHRFLSIMGGRSSIIICQ